MSESILPNKSENNQVDNKRKQSVKRIRNRLLRLLIIALLIPLIYRSCNDNNGEESKYETLNSCLLHWGATNNSIDLLNPVAYFGPLKEDSNNYTDIQVRLDNSGYLKAVRDDSSYLEALILCYRYAPSLRPLMHPELVWLINNGLTHDEVEILEAPLKDIKPDTEPMDLMGVLESCLSTKGYAMMGMPNPETGPDDPVNDPDYIRTLTLCLRDATSSR